MLKGRRTRNAEKISAKPFHDETASPKRKDIKCAPKDNNDNVNTIQQFNHQTAKFHVEPMKLRGGRVKTADISQYLEKKPNPKGDDVITSIALPETVDITNESSDDSFEVQLIEAPIIQLKNEAIVEDTKKSNNNNIFLQEPVLSLNFPKESNAPNRTIKLLHNSFLANSELKNDTFSSSLQPKINSFWKVNVKSPDIQQNTSIEHVDQHVLDLSKPTQVTQIDSTTTVENLIHDEDNSCDSGDSGVVILSGSDGSAITSIHTNGQHDLSMGPTEQTDSSEKRKKPATPHRILCPSPVKNAIIYLQSPPGLLNASSPENSRSKRRAGINKTRKRLICKNDAKVNELADEVAEIKPPQRDVSEIDMCTAIAAEESNDLHIQNRKLIVGSAVPKQTTGSSSKKITEFYPIRRSVRKTKKEVQVERDRDIEKAIREGREEGLKIEHFEGKGRGIVTTRPFSKGEFVVEYIGDLISVSEAKLREQIYAKDDNTGCYMYYFRHKNLQHCIDATAESGKLGRLVNHSRNGNLVTKTVPINNRPHLVLIAKEDIEKDVEVTYDYGDRSKEALQHYPWLAL
ncbi:histone-lysine N-methyltransferase PR-Set7 [Anopheles maculipalpis]|uniref:histone-lysine N-methyltransferase PR-Set7 n=1 Tax=Anopheles maculipalpis TaxID=1496333 RepID=UPI0021597065|nr:histone-lysine N-methyltransferase PR-Set7 [Anopheles maculipalpis]